MSQPQTNQIAESKRKVVKKNYIRQIMNLKDLMAKRKQQRATTMYNLANSKFQNALIIARQLLFTSQKIWKEFNDEFKDQFEQTFYFRTSKNKEHTQYLLDSAIICKIFGKSKKKDDILEIIEKIQIPEIQVINKSQLEPPIKEVIIRYNQMKEIQSRVCAALLLFIEVCKSEKINDYTQKLFNIYINFVQKYYGQLQYATATFSFADYLYENKQYEKAQSMFEICLKIRKQNCLNEAYVDVLINSAICSRYLGKITIAIQRVKSAIQISKDLKKNQASLIDDYHLFLAKLHLQNADYNQAYKNYKIVYKMRSKLQDQDPKKTQIQLNLLYFYKMLQKVSGDNAEQHYNMKDRKDIENRKKIALEIIKDMTQNILNREQFTKFDEFNKKMAHLNLIVSEPFFDLLNSEQVIELNGLLIRLTSCSFQKGVSQVTKCSFFQQKKTRELLLAMNPLINQNKYY